MNIIASVFILVVGLTYSFQPALAASCSQYVNQFDPSLAREGCICGKTLRNLQATFPYPIKVVAACDLRWSNGKQINLSSQKVSLDQYTGGDIPHGEVFVTGNARLSGQFLYEPGNSGDAWFTPRPALIALHHEALAAELRSFKFTGEDAVMERFRVPRNLRNSDCFTANATIEIDGIRLLIGETDEAGAYPVNFKVVNISGFKKCGDK